MALTRTEKRATLTLHLRQRKDEKRRLIVPSASALRIINLGSDEVASVQVPAAPEAEVHQGLKEALIAAAAGEIELVVEYEVSDAMGKRFGVVSGKVRGTATVSK